MTKAKVVKARVHLRSTGPNRRWELTTFRMTDTESFLLKYSLADSPIRGVGDSPTHQYRVSATHQLIDYEYLHEFESDPKGCVRDLCQNPFMHKNRKNWSIAMSL
jgi:hypothetical protein